MLSENIIAELRTHGFPEGNQSHAFCLEHLIAALGENLKQGFAVSNEIVGGRRWIAAINKVGGPVALFEWEGEVSAEGDAPEDAVARLWLELKGRGRV